MSGCCRTRPAGSGSWPLPPTAEGRAELAGPNDGQQWLKDAEQLRLLLREVFTAAGGTHDNWDEYDRVMAKERRAVVLIAPTRVYSNG